MEFMTQKLVLKNSANPGLESYDLTNYTGVRGKNFFLEDQLLKRIFLKEILENHYSEDHISDTYEHLKGFGELAGSLLDELTEIAHREENLGKLVQYNKSGDRVDYIDYCKEQQEIRRIIYEYGVVNLDFHHSWKHPFTMFHRMALAYISNMNGEAGVNCPIAMTDGMIRVIKEIGTPYQKEKYLPLIAFPDSRSYFMCGQYVTERVGGSNVSANRTIARKIKEEEGDMPSLWMLLGEKWFCSNPGDLWVTTAKIEGTNTIGLFVVPRILENGERNSYYLTRKKDIIGSKGKITAECIYENTISEGLGKPSHGLANLIKYVINVSRIHVGVAASGMSRRSLIEAFSYIRKRTAYGRNIIDFPQTQLELIKMILRHTGIVLANFENFNYYENQNPVSQFLTPLLKYISTTTSTVNIKKSILLHGGNGILNDFSILPRLLNDSIINETWEGAHPIIQEHALKALKKPRVLQTLEKEFEKLKFLENTENFESMPFLIQDFFKKWEEAKNELEQLFANELYLYNRPYLVEKLFYLYSYFLFIKESLFSIERNPYISSISLILSGNSNLSFDEIHKIIKEQNEVFYYLAILHKELGFENYSLVQKGSLLLEKEKVFKIFKFLGITN